MATARRSGSPTPEPAPLLKDGFADAAVEGIGRRLTGVPGFDQTTYRRFALEGLAPLSLMARVRHVAAALHHALPADFAVALPRLEAALGDAPTGAAFTAEGMSAFQCAPILEFVALAGIQHPALALPALGRLTRHFTAEFAIRPFLATHLDLTLDHARRWLSDPDPRVRRLASEGTRPLLPWGRHVEALKRRPALGLDLIEPLATDPDAVVRRSVANHLNDASRLDPALALERAGHWARGGDARALATVRHALRTLVKKGDPAALGLLGYDVGADIVLDSLELDAQQVRIGGTLAISVSLRAAGPVAALACVDYAVRYASARGAVRHKVFKGLRLTLAPGEARHLVLTRDFQPRSTRALYPGPHAVELRVNGVLLGERAFELLPGTP